MIKITRKVPQKFVKRLFWNKFPFKVWVGQVKTEHMTGTTHDRYLKLMALVKPYLPVDKNDSWRIVRGGDAVAVYIQHQALAESFVNSFNEEGTRLIEVHAPRDIEHLKLIESDHKIVTRDKFFYEKYAWRVVFKPNGGWNNSQTVVKNWVEDVFGPQEESPERYQFTGGRNPVLYLADENDVMITRIGQTDQIRKVEKVVLLNKNNNKVEDTNESSTVPQTD